MAVGDKIQLAFKSEVTAVNANVTTLDSIVNAASTGLVARVTNLEAGGGAGMTPQQVTDLAACVTDKHTHANKTILDLITAEFTTAEKTKLGNLTDNFKGLYADATARNLGVASPASGNYVLQEDTNTVWYYNGASWLNTGVTSAGDMLKATYDPTNKQLDAFSMDSMVETSTKKIMSDTERDKIKFYRGHAADATEMAAFGGMVEGHYCTRGDTRSVWVYVSGSWVNSSTGGPSIGDTKFSYKTVDHDGWYILNGRAIGTLSPTAQAAAGTLGWVTVVPNTQGKFSLAASPTFTSGTTGGNSTILQSNLPNVTLTGTTASAGAHTHTTNAYTISETTSNAYATNSSTYPNVVSFADTKLVRSEAGAFLAGTDLSYMTLTGSADAMNNASTLHDHAITINVPLTTSNSGGAHTHTFTTSSLNGNVAQVVYMPPYSAKTEFVFLGL